MGKKLLLSGSNLLLMLGDLVGLNLGVIVAFHLWFLGQVPGTNLHAYLHIAPLSSLAALFVFNFFGLYHLKNKLWSEVMASLIISLVFNTGAAIIIAYMLGDFAFPRGVFVIAPPITLLFLGFWRWLMLYWERKSTLPETALLIAHSNEACWLAAHVEAGNYRILGVIIEDSQAEICCNYKVLGAYSAMVPICNRLQPQVLIVSSNIPEEYKNIAIQKSLKYNWKVLIIPNLYEIMLTQSNPEQIREMMVLEVNPSPDQGRQQLKYWFEAIFAGVALVLTLPVMILVAIAIKLDSRGPVGYSQERVSIRGKRFMLYKFRTMIDQAEQQTGPILASQQDPRITRVGRFLRHARLDELPQLINILKGDMSIVGPRPERPCFVEKFEREIPGYTFRHLIKPGLTGLAQISANYSTNVREKLRYDLLYLKGASPLLDLKIILQTIKVLLMRNRAS